MYVDTACTYIRTSCIHTVYTYVHAYICTYRTCTYIRMYSCIYRESCIDNYYAHSCINVEIRTHVRTVIPMYVHAEYIRMHVHKYYR